MDFSKMLPFSLRISLTFVAACLCLVAGQSDQCAQVLKIDCANSYKAEGDETMCCSDMKNYKNLCFFAQEKCRNPALKVLYTGPCVSPTAGATNQTTGMTTSGSQTADGVTANPTDIIYTVFCENKDQLDCHGPLDPVCGSDNIFYRTECDFAKAQCDVPSLRIQELNLCKTARRFRRTLRFV